MEVSGNLVAKKSLVGILSAKQGLVGRLSSKQTLVGVLSARQTKTQTKVVVPTDEAQLVVADKDYMGLSAVIVAPIPNNYGLITWDGATLTVS